MPLLNTKTLAEPLIDGAPTLIRLPHRIKPEDVTIDDLKKLSEDSFTLWTQTSGVKMDGNAIDFESHRYLLPIYNCQDSEIVWRKAAQLGASSWALMKMIWWLRAHPGRKAAMYFPTEQGVQNLSKDRLTPLIKSIADLKYNEDDKLGLRRIDNSSMYLFHLGGVASKDSVPLDMIAFDEVRLCKPQEIDQALERISHSRFKEKLFLSTCITGDTTVIVRDKVTKLVTKKSMLELRNTYQQYEALSYKRIGTQAPVWRPITAFHDQGIRDVVEVTTTGGYKITCTPDHKFAAFGAGQPKFGLGSFTEISQIEQQPNHKHKAPTTGLYALKEIPTYEGSSFDLDTFNIFGIYIAEGTYRNNAISIWQNDKTPRNKELRANVKSWAIRNGFFCTEHEDLIYVSELDRRPDILNCIKDCGTHAETKHIPENLLQGNKAQIEALIQGLVAGDGFVYEDTPETSKLYDYYTVSEQLAKDIQFICMKTGLPVSSTTVRDRIGNPVIINGVQTGVVRHKEYKLSLNPGSHRHVELHTGLGGLAVCSITPANQQQVYDLTIETDSWFFLAESGILAKNCGLPDDTIDRRFKGGTQHIWMARCGCPDGVDLAKTFPDCVVDDKKRNKLYVRCPKCKYVIKDPQNGRYISHNPGAPYHSFSVSQMASKFISIAEIWDMYHRTTNKAEFYNAKLGLPWVDEENRGVTKAQLESCIDPFLEWGKGEKGKRTAMGVDVGGGYCYVTIADLADNKKRIRHVELVESNNPHYMENGRKISPFKRLRQLMKDYNVDICVVDSMPNYDMVLEFAQEFPGKVFAAWYVGKEAKDLVTWSDKPKTKILVKKAGPLLKFKYYCAINRFTGMDFALGDWAKGNVICPPPDKLVQMCFDENTNQLQPEAPMERAFAMYMRLVKQFHVTNDETGEGRHEWIYSNRDPHFAHSWLYCDIGLERLRRNVSWSFA